jgi:glycosyltransferase involved in cell wall biosynthesis
LRDEGTIEWIRFDNPSQPAALNVAIRKASQPIVLFVDDDIEMNPGFLEAHTGNYKVW